MTPLLRIAAIDFLNPAPLMWNFEHPPLAPLLAARYEIERMTPAACAASLANGTADLGLIPIGAYPTIPGLAIIPGCAIASLGAIRSLLLILRADSTTDSTAGNTTAPSAEITQSDALSSEDPDLLPPTATELARIHSVALDTSSRTSALYTQILFRRFWHHEPTFIAHPPALDAMLASSDAALLIGDPALHALHDRSARRARTGERLRYLDLGHLWHQATGTAWVSAFWAVRSAGLNGLTAAERTTIITDLAQSRDAGIAHIPELVAEWAPRLGLLPATVRTYLTHNIYYHLDATVSAGIDRFYHEAHQLGLIPQRTQIDWLS